jgi:hypothetical protein
LLKMTEASPQAKISGLTFPSGTGLSSLQADRDCHAKPDSPTAASRHRGALELT